MDGPSTGWMGKDFGKSNLDWKGKGEAYDRQKGFTWQWEGKNDKHKDGNCKCECPSEETCSRCRDWSPKCPVVTPQECPTIDPYECPAIQPCKCPTIDCKPCPIKPECPIIDPCPDTICPTCKECPKCPIPTCPPPTACPDIGIECQKKPTVHIFHIDGVLVTYYVWDDGRVTTITGEVICTIGGTECLIKILSTPDPYDHYEVTIGKDVLTFYIFKSGKVTDIKGEIICTKGGKPCLDLHI